MPDFDVRVASGAVQKPWTDPVGPDGQASRLRPRGGLDQLYWLGTRGVAIKLLMSVNGVEMPADSALGSRLFTPSLVEGFGPGMFVSVPGWSSAVLWTPLNVGHHVVGIRRNDGGAYLIPFDIQAPTPL